MKRNALKWACRERREVALAVAVVSDRHGGSIISHQYLYLQLHGELLSHLPDPSPLAVENTTSDSKLHTNT